MSEAFWLSLGVASPALAARVPELPEPSTCLQQEITGAPDLDDAALVQHHDTVKVGDRVQAVGDGDDGVVLELLADEVLDRLFGVGVDTGRSISTLPSPESKGERRGRGAETYLLYGSGKEEELSLPVAQCLLGELGVQPATLADRLPEPEARERRLHDGVVVGNGADGVEVLAHRAGEDELVLGDGYEGRPQGQQREGVQGHPVDRDGAGGQRKEAQEGEEEGGLAAARGNVTELDGTTARPAIYIRLRHRATFLGISRRCRQCRSPHGVVLDLVRGLLGEVLDARDGTDGGLERGPELDQHLESLGEGDELNEGDAIVRSRTRVSHCWVSRRM
ncbi:hypothetical protein LX32DRAFT_668517 [Colletotrichum zoysiae]|uniref:Uncharacterized protein n=1 Tax=Colletotrichum zoysiae TaxID=1216348 RepID=A0AAD9LTT5_9PEZI|nr:hypothetical protein LX32DRAFT_668517 [Colletotrichum zoysiae]